MLKTTNKLRYKSLNILFLLYILLLLDRTSLRSKSFGLASHEVDNINTFTGTKSRMQFVIIAKDGTDTEALSRRMAAREAHIQQCDAAHAKGEQLMGCALLNEQHEMCGSVMVVDFPDENALNAWLESEPYVLGNVWQDIQILPCKVGPTFAKK
jgi:uncharacterized protein YciI